MKGLVLAAAVGSMRRLLAVIIALLVIAGASYFVSHKLSNPDHYRYGECVYPPRGLIVGHDCRPPTRAAWQIPAAILIAAAGLGVAAVIAGPRPRRRAPAPELGALPPA
jgi:peptidoglycan/LPS O-acetylase OafA/YrhL